MNDNLQGTHEDWKQDEPLVDGIDFFYEDGLMVLTRHFLLKRGACCRTGCRNCPYDHPAVEQSK